MGSSSMYKIQGLFALFILWNVFIGLSAKSIENRRLFQFLKERSPEHENEYVWFTRDIHPQLNEQESDAGRNENQGMFVDSSKFDRKKSASKLFGDENQWKRQIN